MVKFNSIVIASVLAIGLASTTPAQAQSKITNLFTADGGIGDPRDCSFYLTNNMGWVGVDMSQPNAQKLASDMTFWATVGASINISTYVGLCGGQTVANAWITLPLLAQ